MEKKIILVTGATQGIGKITATSLSRQGHTVILHGRNEQKLKVVVDEIKTSTGNSDVAYIVADLFSLADTKRMTEEFKLRFDRLDVLINNAGAFMNKFRETTEEGLEKTITLNLFAPFLLMNELLESLKKSKSARIINLSSAMHRRGGKPNFDNFQMENNYNAAKAYGLSKLYLIWISRHLAKELKNKSISNVTVNVCHPGAVATNFGQDSDKGFINNLIFKVAYRLMPKPEMGAKTSIYLATSKEVEHVTGKFYGNKEKVEKPHDRYYSVEHEQIVWDYCLKVVQPYLRG